MAAYCVNCLFRWSGVQKKRRTNGEIKLSGKYIEQKQVWNNFFYLTVTTVAKTARCMFSNFLQIEWKKNAFVFVIVLLMRTSIYIYVIMSVNRDLTYLSEYASHSWRNDMNRDQLTNCSFRFSCCLFTLF